MAEDSDDFRVPPLNKVATDAGILSSHGISLELPNTASDGRPAVVKHMSLPAYHSPLRHHQRTLSRTKHVKETLNARSHYSSSDDDGSAIHRINQYIIKQEIGRGSFGAVHLAVDQYGTEYAVKEFSKARLRKRAQSNLLRRPSHRKQGGHFAARTGFNSPLHRLSSADRDEQKENNALDLIKEEIAIMKKLNHNNVVNLIEVLDDPEEDSLYMVLEMCKKGVVMKVGLDETAEPYSEDTCRCWFRDMILGIEYLHAQGIIHRDLKPDNCLITEDDVLKIVDFGVSEMFEKESDMATAKSAGSPAFMPPELCVAKHGQVSGRAADIWSMGVTLYCLRYGKIPFEKHNMLDLYESIRSDGVDLHEEPDADFADLMHRMLEKNPDRRITMDEMRNHPWVTEKGADPLLSAEENCANLVDLPTEAELEHAITGNVKQLLVVMKAVKRFKDLLFKKRPELMGGIFGRSSRLVAPPENVRLTGEKRRTHSTEAHDRKPRERHLATEGVHHEITVSDDLACSPKSVEPTDTLRAEPVIGRSPSPEEDRHETSTQRQSPHPSARAGSTHTGSQSDYPKGQAHDPLTDVLFLDVGANPGDGTSDSGAENALSESPGAVDIDIYETAYEEEMQKILERRGRSPTIYLTRHVESNKKIREHQSVIGEQVMGGLAGLVQRAKEHAADHDQDQGEDQGVSQT